MQTAPTLLINKTLIKFCFIKNVLKVWANLSSPDESGYTGTSPASFHFAGALETRAHLLSHNKKSQPMLLSRVGESANLLELF
jgi:hypothetical protein